MCHCHFEDGFGPDEAERPLWRRGVLRRVALARTEAVVVPSHSLEAIALRRWRLPESRVLYLPNGIEVGSFRQCAVGAPPFPRGDNDTVVGAVAPLRPEKNLGRLLNAFARLDNRATTMKRRETMFSWCGAAT